jgi:hypothetical protein
MPASIDPLDLSLTSPRLPISVELGLDSATVALWRAGVLWNSKVLESIMDYSQPPEPDKAPQPDTDPIK